MDWHITTYRALIKVNNWSNIMWMYVIRVSIYKLHFWKWFVDWIKINVHRSWIRFSRKEFNCLLFRGKSSSLSILWFSWLFQPNNPAIMWPSRMRTYNFTSWKSQNFTWNSEKLMPHQMFLLWRQSSDRNFPSIQRFLLCCSLRERGWLRHL